MIGIVVTAHGSLAISLVETAKLVVKTTSQVRAVSIEPGDDSGAFGKRLEAAIQEVDSGHGVLVLTDMFGGTPSNLGMTKHQPGSVEVLTGVNLPMLIKALQLSPTDGGMLDAAATVKKAGNQSIVSATEMLSVPTADAINPSAEQPG